MIKPKKKLYIHFIKLKKYLIKLIYFNIINLISIKKFNNNQFFITFIYNKTKLIRIYIIKFKSEITDYFIYFKKYSEYSNKN